MISCHLVMLEEELVVLSRVGCDEFLALAGSLMPPCVTGA